MSLGDRTVIDREPTISPVQTMAGFMPSTGVVAEPAYWGAPPVSVSAVLSWSPCMAGEATGGFCVAPIQPNDLVCALTACANASGSHERSLSTLKCLLEND